MRVVAASPSVAVALLLMSCGASQSANSGSPGASVTATATPSVNHTAQPGWKTYISTRWGYSIDYPTGWYDLHSGAPDTQKYFSNENVGAPLQMSASGVYETIDVEPNQKRTLCPVLGVQRGHSSISDHTGWRAHDPLRRQLRT